MSTVKKSLNELKIRATSIGEVGSFGELFLRQPSFKVFSDLSGTDADSNLPPVDLVTILIGDMLQRADQSRLTEDEVRSLAPLDRQHIVEEIIKQNPDWFCQDRGDGDLGGDPIEQYEGENEEELLTRGFRAMSVKLTANLRKTMSGFSERMKAMLGPSIAANMGAAQRVSDTIKGIKVSAYSLPPTIRQEPFHLETPKIPHNPIFDTNEILQEVANEIGEMRDLAAATAEMQRTLNDTASKAIVDFSTGAEKSRKATRNGLWIAGASLLVSIIALGVTAISSHDHNREAAASEATARAQTDRLIASQKEMTDSAKRLSQELSKDLQAKSEPASAQDNAKPNHLAADRGK